VCAKGECFGAWRLELGLLALVAKMDGEIPWVWFVLGVLLVACVDV